MKYTGVIFDMDGLLLNTEDVYTKVSNEILARYGKVYDMGLKQRMMGLREDLACQLFVKV